MTGGVRHCTVFEVSNLYYSIILLPGGLRGVVSDIKTIFNRPPPQPAVPPVNTQTVVRYDETII